MSIDRHDTALIAAGVITVTTALIHGRLLGPLIISPLRQAAGDKLRAAAKALIGPLLHVSTVDWLLGGIALVLTGIWLDGPGRVAICMLVGAQLLYACAANAWASRGRHVGWMLLAVALILTAAGASGG